MKIREFFFKNRGYTPIPFIILVLVLAKPNLYSVIGGLILVILGELIRIWGISYAGSATRTRTVGAPSLVTNGAFAYVRNPLYLGNFLLSLGMIIISWAWFPYILIVFIILFAIQYGLIISLEEDELTRRFGEQYLRYKSKVPRFIPKLVPYDERSEHKFDLKSALKSERRTFQAGAIVLLLILARWYLDRYF